MSMSILSGPCHGATEVDELDIFVSNIDENIFVFQVSVEDSSTAASVHDLEDRLEDLTRFSTF